MATELEETTLGTLLAFANGRSSPERSNDAPHPVYGSNGIIGNTNETNAGEGTIVIGRVGSYCGSLYLSKQRCWVTDNAIRATALGTNDPRFLFFLLSTLSLNGWRAGSGQPLLNQEILSRIPASVPPPSEQHAIAHILGTLDDKIELNRRMSETLEAIARALFKSWFVDFDPVRAKAEGRNPGLPNEIADLFPDSFQDSELGEIPKGWEIGTLAEVALLNPEAWSRQTRPPEITYVDLSNAKWGRIESVAVYRQDDAPSRARRVLRPGDTIVGTVRPGNGSYALVADEHLTGSTGFAVLRPIRAEYAEFVYLAATAYDNIDALAHLSDGGAYPAVRPELVAATAVARSTHGILEEFARLAKPLLLKTAQSERESRSLTALRDSLLPKLMSGELKVKRTGRLVSRVG